MMARVALILFFAMALSPLAWNVPWLLMQWVRG